MTSAVFKIQNLQCEYLPNNPVLEIKNLEIPRGKLLFVVGKSGIGKSTFIETLGLMNHTIASSAQTSIQFFPKAKEESIELKNSWSLPNDKLSEFRKNYFSFIFQNTNLMPNFSAGENMMISLLIKGMALGDAKNEVLRVMNLLSLESSVFDKKITALSGGQRQRLAFVRAITTDFTVLFGDEPTGNLDENTANELMRVLKNMIQEEEKTGIIVSHDLKLAQQFADYVLPISWRSEQQGHSAGEIVTTNIIRRSGDSWLNGHQSNIIDANNYLTNFLSGKPLEA